MTDAYHNSDVAQALRLFQSKIQERDEKAKQAKEAEQLVIDRKSEQLTDLRMLLFHFQNMGVYVTNAQLNSRKNLAAPPQPLRVVERPSSESWAPGVSLTLDHPAVMEIAIPNPKDLDSKGVVVIHLASEHPDSVLFARPFKTMSEAIKNLGEFITRNTDHVQNMMQMPDTGPSEGFGVSLD